MITVRDSLQLCKLLTKLPNDLRMNLQVGVAIHSLLVSLSLVLS